MLSSTMKQLFELKPQIAYFNSANIGPRLQSVSEAGQQAIKRFSSPWEISSEDWFSEPEELRSEFARFNEIDVNSVALIPSVSYGIAIAARNIEISAGMEIVVVKEQYPSNIYAWRRVAENAGAKIKTARRSRDISLSEAVISSINSNTRVVAIPHCHWTDGEPINLVDVSIACKNYGAALVIDASQSLGVRPLDFGKIRPDFVVAVGYKWLLGAYGLGYLYCDGKWQRNGVPLEESWLNRAGSEDFANLVNYVDEYRPGARRFDFGEFPQFISVPMSLAALKQLNKWGQQLIVDHLSAVTDEIRSAAHNAGFNVLSGSRCSAHIVSLLFPSQKDAKSFNEKLKSAGIITSVRGQSIRISPHMHTDQSDVSRLCEQFSSV